ncbi:carboxylesterase family protein [Krasilnikoviella flava]|uniref:Carboxylic ester hydrolase n=1 Tax=Krasilnikoviella flava TaxID=526729 RepID=A0A1T5JDQ9_9MICO|nr:carboxylesterase family protein [Krasilnikoviella flava]SKC49525.1 para-nitrobenzyl esterase [Krasilnikoviella flava]
MLHFTPPCGPVLGWADGDVRRATGIPYARADRFARPAPVEDRTAPFEATSWSPACPQAPVPFLDAVLGAAGAGTAVDEHCQQLSVTMPADLPADQRLPVMVWLHGGSYTSGAGDVPIMDPRPLVAEQRVVVVTVTYRLGLFGYLGDGRERPANLGLLDQLEALRWVRRNIAAFGGDPARVTLFGQSAGGDAVAHLLAVPAAAALVDRAIVQSAPLGISRGRARMNAAMARAAAGVSARTPVDDVVAAGARVARVARGFGLRAAMPFGTQYGHDPLPPEDEIEAAWDAAAPHVALLVGSTAEEARLFVPQIPTIRRVAALPVVGPWARRAMVAAVTAGVYGRPARRFAARHAAAGGTAYRYVVTWAAPGGPWGAAHTVDLPLLFGDEKAWAGAALLGGVRWEDLQHAARRVRAVWGAFARGEDLGDRGEVPGALDYRRVGR